MDEEYDAVLICLSQVVPDKSWMWYALTYYGVWCKGKKARCFEGDAKACQSCEYYNGRGSN